MKRKHNALDMDRATRLLANALAALAVLAGLAYAGRCDHAEAVRSEMGAALWHEVNTRLGGHASDHEIAREYLARREYWQAWKQQRY